jgi:hypothetical protein
MSAKYTLNKEDGKKILKVILYTVASAVIASLLSVLQNLEVPPQYAVILSIVNVLLVAGKKFFEGK